MGRTKRVMKRIEQKTSRQVTFYKRRIGLIKKAEELSVLCGVDVGVIIFSNRGKLHQFSSPTSMAGIIQRYEGHVEGGNAVCEEVQNTKPRMTTGELLQTVERQLGETDVEGLSLTDLVQLENRLETTLMKTRSKKENVLMEENKRLRDEEKLLKEENKHLKEEIERMKTCGQQRETLNLLV